MTLLCTVDNSKPLKALHIKDEEGPSGKLLVICQDLMGVKMQPLQWLFMYVKLLLLPQPTGY